MKKLNLLLLAAMLAGALGLRAQIITTEPDVLQESSQNIVIYYHADQGNKGLNNQPASTPIYAHTGVITSKSTSSSDWKYAPKWLDNSDKYKLTYVSTNLWKLELGDIRTYYGITDSSEKVTQLAFVFRNANGTKEGKTSSGGDIFVEVVEEGLQVSLSSSLEGSLITSGHEKVTFTATASQSATLTIDINGTIIATQQNTTKLTTDYTFSSTGQYTVTASATLGGNTVTDCLEIAYPQASDQQVYPGGIPQQGSVRQADGSVLFCIAAPQKSTGIIVGSWDDYKVLSSRTMHYQEYQGNRYFWTRVEGLDAVTAYPYYYLIDGIGVGDPYARLILDPSNDKYISSEVYPDLIPYPHDKIEANNVPLAVYQENINDYDWQITGFKGAAPSRLNIYELLVRDFTGTEGMASGNGTIRAAIEKLPYIKNLGINAIELMPVNEFNGNNSWGYNPNFYFAPDKAYGTPADYKAFIDACHAQGMAVILDMVFNQTDWLHPWYQLYSVGSNPFYNATAPHAYSVLNDWNQGNALVQQQFEDCLRYWLREYRVDGFRFDLVKGLGDNNSYANSGDAATGAYNASRVARMKRLHAAMKEVNPEAYFINENLAGAQEENEMAGDGELNWANVNNQGAQYAMGYQSDSDMKRFYAPDDQRQWGSTVSYLESHDEQRLAYKQNQYGASGVKGSLVASMHRLGSAACQMILSPGAHMIWQFSELGNFDSTKDANGSNNTNPKTVRWNLFDNANRHGLYDSYSELNHIRLLNPELFDENATFTNNVSASWWGMGRTMYLSYQGKELIAVINPETSGEKTVNVTFQTRDNNEYQVLSKSYNTNPTFNAVTGQVTVPANCYVVLGNRNVSAVDGISVDDNNGVTVYGSYGRIIIEGADASSAVVYDLSARRMSGLEVPAGVYLVRLGSRTYKVAVR